MSILEIVTIILSALEFLGAIPMLISLSRMSRQTALKQHVAGFFGHAAITQAIRHSMNDKYDEKQLEVVTRIVWRCSMVPLTLILKNPEERYNIYKGLSDPNQYPWDTTESEYVK